jgi:hypothetical protein
MLELMTVLPHTVHASIMTEHETIWANLREEFMVTPSSELVLTHGNSGDTIPILANEMRQFDRGPALEAQLLRQPRGGDDAGGAVPFQSEQVCLVAGHEPFGIARFAEREEEVVIRVA